MTMKPRKSLVGLPGAYRVPPVGPPPVLVIDDGPADATATLARLAGAGYPTVAESDGDAVLRLVRARLMRLVISELYIPCSEGACVVAALKRERDRLPRLRVLVHSRHTTPGDDQWALATGADGVLHKPASTSALLREVRRLGGDDVTEPAYDAERDRGRS